MPTFPRETIIEHQHVMGSRLQRGASAYRDCSGFLELLCNPEQLALRVRVQTAAGEFLHPVCDRSH